jgi:hypothetical protein
MDNTTMAAMIRAATKGAPAYQGLETIFEYTNYDGDLVRTNCAQAAAATFLTCQGKLPALSDQARGIMSALERDYPPDQFGGYLGTGRHQVETICGAHGVGLTEIAGEPALRVQLARRNPALVMLGVSAGRLLNLIDLPGGHWMVAYGFDEEYLYLTNWGRMTWDKFDSGWRAVVPLLIHMRLRALVASQPVPFAV